MSDLRGEQGFRVSILLAVYGLILSGKTQEASSKMEKRQGGEECDRGGCLWAPGTDRMWVVGTWGGANETVEVVSQEFQGSGLERGR